MGAWAASAWARSVSNTNRPFVAFVGRDAAWPTSAWDRMTTRKAAVWPCVVWRRTGRATLVRHVATVAREAGEAGEATTRVPMIMTLPTVAASRPGPLTP